MNRAQRRKAKKNKSRFKTFKWESPNIQITPELLEAEQRELERKFLAAK